MININDNKIDSKELHAFTQSKTPYHKWVSRMIEYADLKDGIDFWTVLSKSTGGRRAIHTLFSIDAAKEVCLLTQSKKAKELRRWLISLSNQRDNLELITTKEAAFAFKVINCLQYIENQKEALNKHKEKFVSDNLDNIDPQFIYAQFYKYRSNIVGWDKQKVDAAINQYLIDNPTYKRNRIGKEDISTKLSIMDIGEAIRVAVLDILYSNNENQDIASKFAAMCKQLAKDMQIEPKRNNESDLFGNKQEVLDVDLIKLK
jgi:phage anti-repressor protein